MNQFELSESQKDILQKVVDIVSDFCKRVTEAIRKIAEAITEVYRSYINAILKLDPRKRYRFLKSIGVKNYIPFFKHNALHRCRNNC